MNLSFKLLVAAGLTLGAFVVAIPTTAVYARPCGDMPCYHNPECQKLRNAGKCAAAVAALSKPDGSDQRSSPRDATRQ